MLKYVWRSSVIVSWLSLGIRIVGIILILPFILSRLNINSIAIWQLFGSVNAFILVLDFGFSQTWLRLSSYSSVGGLKILNKATNTQMVYSFRDLFAFHQSLNRRISLFVVLFVAVFGTCVVYEPIMRMTSTVDVWLSWLVMVLTSWSIISGASYAAILQGVGGVLLLRRWEVLFNLLQIIISIFILVSDGGVFLLIINQQIWLIVAAIFYRSLIHRVMPDSKGVKSQWNSDLWFYIWPQTWRTGVGVLSSQGVYQISGFIYSQTAHPSILAAYLLAMRFVQAVSQFSQVPLYVKLPEFTKMYAVGNFDKLLREYNIMARYSYLIFSALSLIVGVYADLILGLIGSNAAFMSKFEWGLLCMAFFADRVGATHLQLYTLSNNVVWHKANGLAGLIAITLIFFLNEKMSTAGFAISLLASSLIWYVPYSILKNSRLYNRSAFKYELTASVPAILIISLLMW